MLVAWDYEEEGLLGSEAFVNDFLLPKINRSHYESLGSMSIDTNLNYNEENDTQRLPDGLQMVFPEVYTELQKNGFKGDFQPIIVRADDVSLGEETARHMQNEGQHFSSFFISAVVSQNENSTMLGTLNLFR